MISKVFFAATAATLALASAPAAAQMLDPDKPEDALEISKRFQCGEEDGAEAVWHFSGNVYSRRAGEPDKLLFKGDGYNIRRCVSVDDPVRGKGWKMVSREIWFYLDPKTGEILDTWDNPWTGKTVEVMHIHNDPVNGRPSYARNADGSPYTIPSLRIEGPYVFMPFEVPLFYTNPLAGDYQDYVGNKYHAMEIFDFAGTADDILDASKPTAYPMVSWVRISEWMPWMEMSGRDGGMVFNATGRKLPGGFEELPDMIKAEVRKSYPIYEQAPPADDTRPNETTWTKFKKLTDAKREAEGGTAKGSQGE